MKKVLALGLGKTPDAMRTYLYGIFVYAFVGVQIRDSGFVQMGSPLERRLPIRTQSEL